MNRKERRAAEAMARKQRNAAPDSNVVAAHEAGHAVARYLTAAEIGYPPEEAISQIEISAPGAWSHAGYSFDGRCSPGVFNQPSKRPNGAKTQNRAAAYLLVTNGTRTSYRNLFSTA